MIEDEFRFSNIPSFAIFCSALVLILAIVFSIDAMQLAIVAIPSGPLSAVLPVITSISETTNKIKPVIAKLYTYQAAKNEDPEAGESTSLLGPPSATSKKDNERLEELKNEKTEIENRAFAINGSSLHDTVSKKSI